MTESLIARHNKRMMNLPEIPSSAIQPVMSALLSFGLIDMMLRKFGATRDRHPADYGASWVDHLAWGADSAFVAARLIFSGQFVGASAVLRSQMERWTENVAYNYGVKHISGESAAEFAARAWSRGHEKYPSAIKQESDTNVESEISELDFWEDERRSLGFQGPSVIVGKDYRVYPGTLMELLSELLHGRGDFIKVLRWDACDLLADEPTELVEASQWLSDVLMLYLRQIRVCLATLAMEQGKPELAPALFALPERIYAGGDAPIPSSLFPLLPQTGLSPDILERMRSASYAYEEVMRGRRPAGRLFRDGEMVHLHFYERRARAGRWALKALEEEKEKLGDGFNIDGLGGRDSTNVMATEMAGVLSLWLGDSPEGNAAAMCASALRTAHWLWLEDDDRSMAALRVVLEQCARLRVWATKPGKAAKLEESLSSTPKDWVNAAGWRRLAPLNRALGEFAHFHARIRRQGAWEILVGVQSNGGSPDSIYTARGHILETMTAMVMVESTRSVARISPVMENAFREITADTFTDPDELQARLEEFLDRAMSLKDVPRGPYAFHGPAQESAE
ncbi:hypothetical protein J7E90_27585 [Streptomyces sp. ISL-111]|uniref:hypothetical protein n=1 Tax=Streptomyces sp. ISL-111 TaxID=2819175 RepID=UPI001BE54258|nr:hypothetical protein [Streptomyces sp. ISL-111]MBT2380968.1 hypothetical protein [Streptomyces sp. ISL-111]